MTNNALLNNVQHQDIKIITERSAQYGDDKMFTLVLPFEFRTVQAYYPILLQQDASGTLFPVALFGFEEGENLFLSDSGWQANYLPAMVKREPFLIGRQQSEGSEQEILSIDMDHPRVNTEEGEALFQPLGGRTPFLDSMVNLLETIHGGLDHGRRFIDALQQYGLTEAITYEVTLNDRSTNQLIGFHGINEEKVRNLDGDTLAYLSNEGFLMPLFMMISSVPNVQRLVDFKNAKLAA